jgi:hypothetical protein
MGGVGSGRLRIGQPPLTREAKRKRNRDRSRKWRAKNAERNRENIKAWRKNNPEAYSKLTRDSYLRTKFKKMKKYLSDLQYERQHPGRAIKYYHANKDRILQRQREYRQRKREQRMKKAA